MATLYQTLINQGVKNQDTYGVQGQLYSKLGGSMGNYAGTAQQNVWLQGQLGNRNYGEILNGGAAAQPQAASAATSSAPNYASIIAQSNAERDNFAKSQREQAAALEAENQRKQADYLNRFTGAINGQETLTAMNGRLSKELGVDNLRAVSGQLGDTIRNLPKNENNLAQGTFLNASQVQEAVRSKLAELTPGYQDVLSKQNEAESRLGEQLQLGTADQNRALQPLQMEGDMLGDEISRRTSGFYQQQESELNLLMDKISQRQELTVAEIQRAQQLADAETEFTRQKELLRYEQSLKPVETSSSLSIPGLTTLGAGPTEAKPTTKPAANAWTQSNYTPSVMASNPNAITIMNNASARLGQQQALSTLGGIKVNANSGLFGRLGL